MGLMRAPVVIGVVTAVIAVVCVAACGLPAPRRGNVSDFEAVLDAVPRLLERDLVTGAIVAWIRDGQLAELRAYGFADAEQAEPVRDDTVFQVASISKSVSAWGVMKLVEEGRLELDSPIVDKLTRWTLPESEFPGEEVTVRRLLSHTAGLSLGGYPGFPPERELPSVEASLSGDSNGSGDVRLVLEPGTAHQYSGGGYTLLQLLIEEVSGQTFPAFMQREVLEPLGMRSSSFEWTPALRARTAVAYDGGRRPMPNYLYTAKAAAGLYTTGQDLARFVMAVMPGPDGEPPGRGVLRPDSIDLMLTAAAATEGTYGLGYSLEILSDGTRLAWHGGDNRGWKLLFASVPDRGDGIVVLTNSDSGLLLTMEVASVWGSFATGEVPARLVSIMRLKLIAIGLAALFWLAAAVQLTRAALGLRSGRRVLGWSSERPGWRLLGIVLYLAAALFCWVLLYGELPVLLFFGQDGTTLADRLPAPARWVASAVICWCALSALMHALVGKIAGGQERSDRLAARG